MSLWSRSKNVKNLYIYSICIASACTTETHLDPFSFTYECSNNNINKKYIKKPGHSSNKLQSFCCVQQLTIQFQPLASHRPLTISCTTPHTSMKLKYQPKLLWLVVRRRNISAHFIESETSVTISCITPHRHEVKISTNLAVAGGWRGGGGGGGSVFWTGIGAICKCWAAWVASS